MPINLQAQATWESMLAELRSRVKLHPTLGTAHALESILSEANDYVFDQLDDGLPWHSSITVQAGAQFTPFVSDTGLPIARGSVRSVWLDVGGQRLELPQGITDTQRGIPIRARPDRYDSTFTSADPGVPQFQVELWPVPDQTYVLRVNHNRVNARFAVPGDVPSAPYRLVLGYAVSVAKAHYGQQDAQVAGQSFKTMLTLEKEKQREGRRFLPAMASAAPGPMSMVANMIGSAATPAATPAPTATPAPGATPAPTSAPATTFGKSEADVQTAIATPAALWWYPQYQPDRAINPDGTGGPPTVNNSAFAYLRDHKTGNAHPLSYASNTNSMVWFTGPPGDAGIYTSAAEIGLGGSTQGFVLCAALRIDGGFYNTILSDVNGAAGGAGAAKNGSFLRYSGDTPGLTLSVGTGLARVAVTDNKASLAGTGSVPTIVCAWFDPVAKMLNLQLDDRAVVSSPCASMAAGLNAMSFFANPIADSSFGASSTADHYDQFNGAMFGMVFVKDSCLTATQRDTLRYWMADQCSVTLTTTQSGATAPASAPTPAPAPASGGYVFGARTDLVNGAYAFGIAPTNYSQVQMDTRVKACYDAWKAARVVAAPAYTPSSGIYAGTAFAAGACKYVAMGGTQFACVSEGMGYGMLITVLMAGYDAAAQAQFDAMYKMVRGHPAYGAGTNSGASTYLMDYKVNADMSSAGGGYAASDGDMDIALSLLMAHRQWGSTGAINYYQQALNTIGALKVLFAPNGLQWDSYHNVSRVSDYMIGHFRSFKKATSDAFWDNARTNSLAMMQTIVANFAPSTGLMPGFIYDPFGTAASPNTGPRPDTIAHIDGSGIEQYYDANSVRIPWRLATDYVLSGDAAVKALANQIVTTLKASCSGDPSNTTYAYKLDGTPLSGLYYEPTTGGCLVAGALVDAAHQAFENLLFTDASIIPKSGPGFDSADYYAAELQLLPLIVASRNWWAP